MRYCYVFTPCCDIVADHIMLRQLARHLDGATCVPSCPVVQQLNCRGRGDGKFSHFGATQRALRVIHEEWPEIGTIVVIPTVSLDNCGLLCLALRDQNWSWVSNFGPMFPDVGTTYILTTLCLETNRRGGVLLWTVRVAFTLANSSRTPEAASRDECAS